MKKKVTHMSDYNDNTLFISAEQAIVSLQEFLKENPDFDKVFLLAANTKDRDFLYAWWKGKLLTSEAITALSLALKDQIQVLA